MNTLLPTDFSKNSWNAITYALALYNNTTCNFYVLHVNRVEIISAGDSSYMPTPELIAEVYTKPAKNKLRDLLKKISLSGNHNKNHKFYTVSDI